MFVGHKNSKSFDVFRNDDRCAICGVSAVVTYRDGIHCGYCYECAPKRTKFVEDIVGDILICMYENYIGDCLNGLEMMRKLFFQERIYYLIDKYYGDDKDINNEFWGEHLDGYGELEFYDNKRFLEKVYDEKFEMMRNLIAAINLEIEKAKSLKIKKAYKYYLKDLEEMYECDKEKVANFRNDKSLLKINDKN